MKPPPEPLPEVKMPGLLDALAQSAADMRRAYRLNDAPIVGWYVSLPEWVIVRGGGWDEFAAQFEQSWARQLDLQLSGVIGFEVCEQYPGWGARRYTLERFRQQEEQQ